VSVQYLQKPVGVLRELARVLKPGSPVAITFSNLCFPTKAVMIWQAVPDVDHQRLVMFYLEQALARLIKPGHVPRLIRRRHASPMDRPRDPIEQADYRVGAMTLRPFL